MIGRARIGVGHPLGALGVIEDEGPKTLRCTVKCGKNTISWCKTADYTDAQAQDWVATHFKKRLDCKGIGTRAGGAYVIEPDGSIVWKGGAVASGTDKVFCPAAVLQQPPAEAGVMYAFSPQADEVVTRRRTAQKWAKDHPCAEMRCRDADSGRPVTFYDCPARAPGDEPFPEEFPEEEKKAGPKLATVATFGLAAAGIALVAAAFLQKKDAAAAPVTVVAETR